MLLLFVPVIGALTLLLCQGMAVAFGASPMGVMRWLQVGQNIGLFILPVLLYTYLSEQPVVARLRLGLPLSGSSLVLGMLTMLVAQPAVSMLATWNEQMTLPTFLQPVESWMQAQESASAAITEQLLNVHSVSLLLLNILVIALMTAVGEEFFFRSFLIPTNLPSRARVHIVIWLAAALFSAIHMQFYGFVPRMLLGAMFGYVLVWSGSIWVPVLMHFTNNATAVIIAYIAYNKGLNLDSIEALGTGSTLWVGIVSLGLTIACLYCLRRSCTMKSASSRISSGS